MPSPSQRLGGAVRVARLARGMSLDDLAMRANVSKQFISMLETGRKMPRSSTLIAIRNALGVSLDYLMTHEHVTVQAACSRELDRIMDVERVSAMERCHPLADLTAKEHST